MKVSVSLPAEDLEFVDEHARRLGFSSRSAVLHEAIRLLRRAELEDAYERAFSEWESGDDAVVWDSAASDGLD